MKTKMETKEFYVIRCTATDEYYSACEYGWGDKDILNAVRFTARERAESCAGDLRRRADLQKDVLKIVHVRITVALEENLEPGSDHTLGVTKVSCTPA